MFYLTFLSLRKNGFDGFSMFFSSLPGVLKVEIYLELGGKRECPGETMGIGEHTKQGWTINKRCLCQHAQLANKPCEGLRLVKEHSNNLYKHFYLLISALGSLRAVKPYTRFNWILCNPRNCNRFLECLLHLDEPQRPSAAQTKGGSKRNCNVTSVLISPWKIPQNQWQRKRWDQICTKHPSFSITISMISINGFALGQGSTKP